MRSTSFFHPWRLSLIVVVCGTACGPHRPSESLVRQLQSEKPETRVRAAEQIIAKKPPAGEVLPALVQAFRDPRVSVYSAAARAILSLGDPGIDALAGLMSDNDAWVRCRAAETLGLARPAAVRAVPSLIRALRDSDFCVTGKAVAALGSIGKPAVPALLDMLNDNNPAVRRNAGDALGLMAPELQAEAVKILLPDLKSKDEFIRGEAAVRLSGMGGVAVPVFLAALRSGDLDLVHRSLDGLEQIGDSRPEVVDGLLDLLNDPVRTVRLRASGILGRFGQKDPAIYKRLVPLLSSSNERVLRGAIAALGDMGAAGAGAVPDLIRLMDTHPNPEIRSDAAETLFKMGTTESVGAAERRNMEQYRKR